MLRNAKLYSKSLAYTSGVNPSEMYTLFSHYQNQTIFQLFHHYVLATFLSFLRGITKILVISSISEYFYVKVNILLNVKY